MRRAMLVLLGFLVIGAGPAPAGIYHPAEATLDPGLAENGGTPLPYPEFRKLLNDYIGIAVVPLEGQEENAIRKRVREHRDQLEAKAKRGPLSVEDKVNLSASYIRLREPQKAVTLLQPAASERQPNFMILANLATAEQQAGRPERARGHLQTLREVWPAEAPGFTREQLAWFRRVEGYHLRLLTIQARAANSGRSPLLPTVEELFAAPVPGEPGKWSAVRFVGESGAYEVGKMADAEKKKLPPDAMAIVQQLLLWLPDDGGLVWLLGELCNAQGEVEWAATIFDDCVNNRALDAPEIRKHRQMVNEALPQLRPPPAPPSTYSWWPTTSQLAIAGTIFGSIIAVIAFLQVLVLYRRFKRTS